VEPDLLNPIYKFLQLEQQERRRLSQRLHDDLQQMIVVSKMMLQKFRLSRNDKDLEQVFTLLDETLSHARYLAVELSPPLLFKSGIKPALEWLGKWTLDTQQLQVQMEFRGKPPRMSEEMGHFVLWSVKELLLGFKKHSGALTAQLEVEFEENGNLAFSIRGDNTAGASSLEEAKTQEIVGVQDRLDMLGGQLSVQNRTGKGMEIQVFMPAKLFNPTFKAA
jgi:two-component system CheB/CheR fusion protein